MSCSHWWGAETASNEKAGAGVAARAGGSFTVTEERLFNVDARSHPAAASVMASKAGLNLGLVIQ